MQIHLNGFRPGDPDVSPAPIRLRVAGAELPAEVDVLIVGSGPAGLVLAAQLAEFPGITTRIVERRSGPIQLGQADGIACRTVEMFDAFGLSERPGRGGLLGERDRVLAAGRDRSVADRAHRTRAGRGGRAVGVPARDREPGADP